MIGDILQPTHLLLILVVAMVVLGPKRLPEAVRAVGHSIYDFKGAINGDRREQRADVAAPDAPEPVKASADSVA